MASAVPYTGDQDISPQVNPLPRIGVNSPVEAFGGAVAGAIQHAGQITEGVGKEIFSRAEAMQTMDQMVQSDGAAVDAMNKSTDRYLEFDKLKGNDRVAGFQQYQQDLQKIRDDGMAQLHSPIARQNYLQQTRRNESQMIWHGGVLARQGADEANLQSGLNKIDAIGNKLSILPGGPGDPTFDQGIKEAQQAAGDVVHMKYGYHPGTPEYDDAAGKLVSTQVAKVALSRSRANPADGKAFFDKATSLKILHPEDGQRISEQIDNANDVKLARTIGHKVASGSPEHWGEEPYPTPLAAEGVKAGSATNGSFDSVSPKAADGSYQVGRYGVGAANLTQWLKDTEITDERGKRVLTETDFRNSAKAQEDLYKTKWPELQTENKTFNAALKAWQGTDSPQASTAALRAIAKNADPRDVVKKAESAAAKASPNSPILQDNASEIASQNQNRARQVDILSNKRDMQSVMEVVDGAASQDGRVPTSIEEARKDPKFAAFDQLPAEDQHNVLEQIRKNNQIGGYVHSARGDLIFQRLSRIAIERNGNSTPEELNNLVNTDVTKLPITREQRQSLLKAQGEVLNGQIQNPNISHALNLPAVKDLLSAAGIAKGNPEYDKFQQTYHDAIVAYGLGAERSVKNDGELTEIANGLISKQAIGYIWNGPQPYQGLTTFSPQLKKVGESMFRQVHQRSADPNNDDDVKAMNQLVLESLYKKYGSQSKPIAPKRTDQVPQ